MAHSWRMGAPDSRFQRAPSYYRLPLEALPDCVDLMVMSVIQKTHGYGAKIHITARLVGICFVDAALRQRCRDASMRNLRGSLFPRSRLPPGPMFPESLAE